MLTSKIIQRYKLGSWAAFIAGLLLVGAFTLLMTYSMWYTETYAEYYQRMLRNDIISFFLAAAGFMLCVLRLVLQRYRPKVDIGTGVSGSCDLFPDPLLKAFAVAEIVCALFVFVWCGCFAVCLKGAIEGVRIWSTLFTRMYSGWQYGFYVVSGVFVLYEALIWVTRIVRGCSCSWRRFLIVAVLELIFIAFSYLFTQQSLITIVLCCASILITYSGMTELAFLQTNLLAVAAHYGKSNITVTLPSVTGDSQGWAPENRRNKEVSFGVVNAFAVENGSVQTMVNILKSMDGFSYLPTEAAELCLLVNNSVVCISPLNESYSLVYFAERYYVLRNVLKFVRFMEKQGIELLLPAF